MKIVASVQNQVNRLVDKAANIPIERTRRGETKSAALSLASWEGEPADQVAKFLQDITADAKNAAKNPGLLFKPSLSQDDFQAIFDIANNRDNGELAKAAKNTITAITDNAAKTTGTSSNDTGRTLVEVAARTGVEKFEALDELINKLAFNTNFFQDITNFNRGDNHLEKNIAKTVNNEISENIIPLFRENRALVKALKGNAVNELQSLFSDPKAFFHQDEFATLRDEKLPRIVTSMRAGYATIVEKAQPKGFFGADKPGTVLVNKVHDMVKAAPNTKEHSQAKDTLLNHLKDNANEVYQLEQKITHLQKEQQSLLDSKEAHDIGADDYAANNASNLEQLTEAKDTLIKVKNRHQAEAKNMQKFFDNTEKLTGNKGLQEMVQFELLEHSNPNLSDVQDTLVEKLFMVDEGFINASVREQVGDKYPDYRNQLMAQLSPADPLLAEDSLEVKVLDKLQGDFEALSAEKDKIDTEISAITSSTAYQKVDKVLNRNIAELGLDRIDERNNVIDNLQGMLNSGPQSGTSVKEHFLDRNNVAGMQLLEVLENTNARHHEIESLVNDNQLEGIVSRYNQANTSSNSLTDMKREQSSLDFVNNLIEFHKQELKTTNNSNLVDQKVELAKLRTLVTKDIESVDQEKLLLVEAVSTETVEATDPSDGKAIKLSANFPSLLATENEYLQFYKNDSTTVANLKLAGESLDRDQIINQLESNKDEQLRNIPARNAEIVIEQLTNTKLVDPEKAQEQLFNVLEQNLNKLTSKGTDKSSKYLELISHFVQTALKVFINKFFTPEPDSEAAKTKQPPKAEAT